VTISFGVFGTSLFFSGVYVIIDQHVRRALWDDLRSIHAMAPSFWLVMGYLNALFGTHEKT